jgi:hypothetical protein
MMGWLFQPILPMINKLTIFPVLMRDDWLFRISISDSSNIMLIVLNVKDPNIFMMRYFSDSDEAIAFIDEAAAGKHIDYF